HALLSYFPSATHDSSLFLLRLPRPPRPTLFPYTTLFRSRPRSSWGGSARHGAARSRRPVPHARPPSRRARRWRSSRSRKPVRSRSEEHTSELQSPYDLVCRLLLEKKKRTADKVESHLLTI